MPSWVISVIVTVTVTAVTAGISYGINATLGPPPSSSDARVDTTDDDA